VAERAAEKRRVCFSGVFVNGYRLVDVAVYGDDRSIVTHGDIFVAAHPFSLASSPT